MPRIGVMQGRMLPPEDGRFQCFPRAGWAHEFPRAAAAGLTAIEWIYDLHGTGANPIETDEGIASVLDLSRKHNVAVVSLCADYYMDRPFVNSDASEEKELIDHFLWLLERCEKVGIVRVVVPFVDASRMENAHHQTRVIDILSRILPQAEKRKIELHLETSLGPADFARFLDNFASPFIKANYDSGNSSSLGYHPREEFAAYGHKIGSVHIKDRLKGGGTVPLGQGDADFDALFTALRDARYGGDYILQVARPTSHDEVDWARQNLSFVRKYLGGATRNGANQ